MEISVYRGEREWFLSEQVPADFAQLAEWFDANPDRLVRQAGLLNRRAGRALVATAPPRLPGFMLRLGGGLGLGHLFHEGLRPLHRRTVQVAKEELAARPLLRLEHDGQ